VYRLGHGGECTASVKRSLACLLQLRDRRSPSIGKLVQDVQSAMRLPERTNGLAADRRTAASRSHNCDKHDSDHLRMQCIRRRALTCLEATPTRRPFWFLQRRLPASGLALLPARTSPNGTVSGGVLQLLPVHVLCLCSVFRSCI